MSGISKETEQNRAYQIFNRYSHLLEVGIRTPIRFSFTFKMRKVIFQALSRVDKY